MQWQIIDEGYIHTGIAAAHSPPWYIHPERTSFKTQRQIQTDRGQIEKVHRESEVQM